MSFFVDDQSLVSLFKPLFEAASPNIPVSYPGFPKKPVDGAKVSFRVIRAATVPSQIGGARRRNYGSVQIHMVLPTGNGPGELLNMADAVAGMLRRKKAGNVTLYEPSLSGPTDDGSLVWATLDVPFRSDYGT